MKKKTKKRSVKSNLKWYMTMVDKYGTENVVLALLDVIDTYKMELEMTK